MRKAATRIHVIKPFPMIFILLSPLFLLVPSFDGSVKSRERRPFLKSRSPEFPELSAAHNSIENQNPIPPFFPFPKGCPAFRGIWKRGARGDLGGIGLADHGLIHKREKSKRLQRDMESPGARILDPPGKPIS
jgi:hypothetical protein